MHLTVKQVFPREPYRLKIHRDAQYVPKPPRENGFSDTKAPTSYQMCQRMCLDTEELARRSAIYASLADSMVASVIEELSPKDERMKLLREKLAIIQEAQVSAVSAGFAAASNLQLLHCDALLKNFGFQPQVLSTVRTAPFEGSHVLGPDPKELQNRVRTIRQADRMAGSSVTFAQKHRETKSGTKVTSSRKTSGHQSSTDWGLLLPPRPREQWHRSRPFVLAPAGEPATDPILSSGRSPASPLQLPQSDSIEGFQVGAAWQTLPRIGGVCWATAGPLALSRMGWA